MTSTIIIYDVDGNERYTALAESDSKRVFSLMENDYIKLVFQTKQSVKFELGDYIATDYGKFEITSPQQPTYDSSTGVYKYELQFDALYVKWKNKKFRFNPSASHFETSFSLTSTIAYHMQILLENIAYHGYAFNGTAYTCDYYCDSDDDALTTSQYITYDSVSIYEALDKIAEAFDVEWWVTENVIHLGRPEYGKETSTDFELNVNVAEMSANDSEGDDYFNVFIAFGSDKNIPYNYRNSDSTDESLITYGVAESRLMLPEDTPVIYLDGIDENTPAEQKVEGVVVFDDIYPKTNGQIAEVIEFEKEVEVEDDETVDETTTELVKLYRFRDANLEFDEDYILSGETLQVTFSTGKLAGMTFDVEFNPLGVGKSHADYSMFEIVRNNNYGIYLPAENYAPAVGDEYSLIGFDATAMTSLGLVAAAEQELLERAQAYAAKLQVDPHNYDCTMMADYLYGRNPTSYELDNNYAKTFDVGDVINLINTNMFGSAGRTSRVIGYEYRLDEPYNEAKITVGENTNYSKSSDLEGEIDAKFDAIAYGNGNTSVKSGGNNIYIITSNDTTAESNTNVYSALRTKNAFARKLVDDTISSLWEFVTSEESNRGIQSDHYSSNGLNADNMSGHGFRMVTDTENVSWAEADHLMARIKAKLYEVVISTFAKFGDYSEGALGAGAFLGMLDSGDSYLEVDRLLVRKIATFVELVIKKIKYSGGQIILSPASLTISSVERLDSSGNVISDDDTETEVYIYRCYFETEDNDGKTIQNEFEAGDLVRCQTFNLQEDSEDANNGQRYWWRLVDAIGTDYIDLANHDEGTGYDYNSMAPQVGDEGVQLGNTSDTTRQSAIILSTVDDDSPSLKFYSKITTFSLEGKANTYFSRTGNRIVGEMVNEADGKTYVELINETNQSLQTISETVDATSEEEYTIWFGTLDWTTLETTDWNTQEPSVDWDAYDDNDVYFATKHIGDIYYNTSATEGTGGRMFRFVKDDTGEYYWDEITDEDSIAALEQALRLRNDLDSLADDGIISGGSEKSQLYVAWYDALNAYLLYATQTDEQSQIDSSIWTAYENAFFAVANMLNNGTEVTSDNLNDSTFTLAWFEDMSGDTNLSETSVVNADGYRVIWNTYNQCLTAWTKALSDLAQSRANDLQDQVDDIVSDGIIKVGAEKTELYKEWCEALADYKTNKTQATNRGLTTESVWASYVEAFLRVATMLNNGDPSSPSVTEDEVATLTPAWFANIGTDTDTDIILADTDTVDADTYRDVWGEYYTWLATWLAYISELIHQKADDAITQTTSLADDGIISGGSEKSQLYLSWYDALKAYLIYVTQTEEQSQIDSSIWTAYEDAFFDLATMLNDGDTVTADNLNDVAFTPLWLEDLTEDTNLSETPVVSADGYRAIWNAYNEALTAWTKALSDLAQSRADDLQSQVDDIVSDGIISGGDEKSVLLKEWNEALANYTTYKTQAEERSLTSASEWVAFQNAFLAVGTMLNDGTSFTTDDVTNGNTPAWVQSDNLNTSVTLDSADTYRSTWSAYYESLASWISYLSEQALTKADDLQEQVDDIVSDGVISANEKGQLLLDWQEVAAGYKTYKEEANARSLTGESYWTEYAASVLALGTMLHNGNPDTDNGGSITYTETMLLANTIPSWVANSNISENTILSETPILDAETYRSYWQTYYECLAEWTNYLAELALERTDDLQVSYVEVTSQIQNLGDSIEAYTQKIGYVQAVDDEGNLLYYDADGNETTEATRTETDADGNETTVNNDKVLVEAHSTRNGLVTTADYAALKSYYADTDGVVRESSISTRVSKDISEAEIKADQISLEGYTSINGGVRVDEDGNLIARNGTFQGVLKSAFAQVSTSNSTPMYLYCYLDDAMQTTTAQQEHQAFMISDVMNLKCSTGTFDDDEETGKIILPCSATWEGTRVILVNSNTENSSIQPSWVLCEKTDAIDDVVYYNKIRGISVANTYTQDCYLYTWQGGITELLCVRKDDSSDFWDLYDTYYNAYLSATDATESATALSNLNTHLATYDQKDKVEWWIVNATGYNRAGYTPDMTLATVTLSE